ncbi:MAG: heme-binding protein [Planctomycetota bacterium]
MTTAALLLASTIVTQLEDFPVLQKLVREAGLEPALATPGSFALLAPPEKDLAGLELSKAELMGLLGNHIIDRKHEVTLHGETISWDEVKKARSKGKVRICSNGLILPVSRAFVPAKLTKGTRVQAGKSFRMRVDAPLPDGWPRPGPIEEPRLKFYPVYRLAIDEKGNFGTLFRHIQRKKIEMTAPVEMSMDENLKTRSMSFLYRFPEQGEAGADGRVAIRNVEPRFAISVGMRGTRSDKKMEKALAKIRADLKGRRGWREVEGSLQLLGFNDPFIFPWNQYWEVVLEIEPVTSEV